MGMRRLLLCSLVACGSPAASVGDDVVADAPPLTGDMYALNFGPVTVHPGQENTQCVNLRLSNTTAIKVHQMRNLLSTGSHHLILYKNDMDATETTTPFDCTPFKGALNLSGRVAPVMITQKQVDELTLPEAVAYTFDANQMIRIEMHYINATDADIAVTATAEFYAVPDSQVRDEADILFIGTPDITIAAGETKDIEAYFAPGRASLDLSGAKFFAITGHTHQFGTNVVVSTAPTNGGARTPIYTPAVFEWNEPETVVHQPEFTVPQGGGFDVTCSYHNTSNQTVEFGESANDEMCFFWAYYYPSKGSHVCVHSNFMGFELDLCCPDAADLCQMLEDRL